MNEQELISVIEDETELSMSELPLPSAKNDFDAYLTILHDLRHSLDEAEAAQEVFVQAESQNLLEPEFASPIEALKIDEESVSPLELETEEIETGNSAAEESFVQNAEGNYFVSEPIFESESNNFNEAAGFASEIEMPPTANDVAEVSESDAPQNQIEFVADESENESAVTEQMIAPETIEHEADENQPAETIADFAENNENAEVALPQVENESAEFEVPAENDLNAVGEEVLTEYETSETSPTAQNFDESSDFAPEISAVFSHEQTSEISSPQFEPNFDVPPQTIENSENSTGIESIDETPTVEFQSQNEVETVETAANELEPNFDEPAEESSFAAQSENNFQNIEDEILPEKSEENFAVEPVAFEAAASENGKEVELSVENSEISLPDAAEIKDKFVVFKLAESFYAFPAENVAEISYPLAMTKLPFVPEWLAGVANLRGDIVAVIDLRRLWNKSAAELGAKSKMLVVSSGTENLRVCLIVDEVREIRPFAATEIAAGFDAPFAPYLKGIANYEDGALCLINAEQFLASSRLSQFD